MPNLKFSDMHLGQELPALTTPAVDRRTLALYAGASGDHNAIHIDLDFARAAGMPDVFAQGMLSMAYLGRLLTNWVPQRDIRTFGVRFTAITHLADRLTCTGKVIEKNEEAGIVRLEISARNQDGDIKLAGEAVIAPKP